MKLIYHSMDGKDKYSPFDEKLIELSKDKDICLVSPYLSLGYLNRLLSFSKSWRLVTDYGEWISSHKNSNDRFEILQFIRCNLDRIRHLDNVHAKVLISDDSAFLGSSNFTYSGMLKREEMSVCFSDKADVEELQEWFNSLWKRSVKMLEDDILKFVEEKVERDRKLKDFVEKEKIKDVKFIVRYDKVSKVNSVLVPVKQTDQKQDYEKDLILAIRKIKRSKEWINKFFDLMEDLINFLDVEEYSPKIVMSVTKSHEMSLLIGQRYVVVP